MINQNPATPLAYDDFLVSVSGLWAAWTSGRLDGPQAAAGIRDALTELDDQQPPTHPQFAAFQAGIRAVAEDWIADQVGEEDAMVRILDAITQLRQAGNLERHMTDQHTARGDAAEAVHDEHDITVAEAVAFVETDDTPDGPFVPHTEPAPTLQQLRAQLVRQAADLLETHRAQVYGQNWLTYAEATAQFLNQRGMLTSRELRAAETDADRNAHRVFNHVPIARFKDEQRRAGDYIRALERATTVLLAQIDAVSGLAAVKKTVKGQQMAEQASLARTFVEKAEARHRDSETRSSDYPAP